MNAGTLYGLDPKILSSKHTTQPAPSSPSLPKLILSRCTKQLLRHELEHVASQPRQRRKPQRLLRVSQIVPPSHLPPLIHRRKDFRGGFTTELAGGVIDDAVSLMNGVNAQTVLADNVKKVFDEARRNDKCRGMEARSVWRLFSEDGGRDLQGPGLGPAEQEGRLGIRRVGE